MADTYSPNDGMKAAARRALKYKEDGKAMYMNQESPYIFALLETVPGVMEMKGSSIAMIEVYPEGPTPFTLYHSQSPTKRPGQKVIIQYSYYMDLGPVFSSRSTPFAAVRERLGFFLEVMW